MIPVQEIQDALAAATHGSKREVINRYARMHGVSEKTIYRELARVYGEKVENRTSKVSIPNNYINVIAKLKSGSISVGHKGREIRTEDAIEIAEERGLVPPGVLNKSTVNRRLSQLGFRKQKPVVRYLESFVNQAHYLDFSRSEYISIDSFDRVRGSYLLKTNEKSLRYKNKSGPAFSLWLAGMRDGRSGVRLVKYYTVTGENLFMGLDFVTWCWTRPPDEHPLNGIPDFLRIDNGSLSKSEEFKSMLRALTVEMRLSKPYNKNAMGKIERPWRSFWQSFELKLYEVKGKDYRLYPDELNELAFMYTLEEMRRKHSWFKESKQQVYERGLLSHPPRIYTGDITRLASRALRRKVGEDLVFRYKNVPYAAPARYQGKYVLVTENINGEIVAEGEHDGVVFPISLFEPQAFDDFKSFPDTYQERMLKEYKEEKSLRMQPKPEILKPQSPFIPAAKQEETLDYNSARIYIARQLGLPSYSAVAHMFDDLLAQTLDKKTIDIVIEKVLSLTQKHAI